MKKSPWHEKPEGEKEKTLPVLEARSVTVPVDPLGLKEHPYV